MSSSSNKSSTRLPFRRALVLCIGSCLLSVNSATFDYKLQGEDWTDTCDTGSAQSPVDIDITNTKSPSYSTSITDVSGYTSFTVAQNGHSIQVTPKGLADFVSISNEYYNLEQYHFHAKSEHRLGSSQKDMEAHLLFRSASDPNRLAVWGFLFEGVPSTSSNKKSIPAITTLSSMGLTTAPSSVESIDKTLDILTDLLNTMEESNTKLFTYDGSLTTPPCSEIVRWYVFGNPINVDEAIIQPLIDAMEYTDTKGNYRDTKFATNTNAQYLTTYNRLKTDTSYAHSSGLSGVCTLLVLMCTSLLIV